jgi:predicted adenine nucleotide alpha hydrolase (AANH) superfamily ATPase
VRVGNLYSMKILLHICCSNCALYPVKMIGSEGHALSGFWFNPNIHPVEEYTLRLDSLKELSDKWRLDILPVDVYKPEEYFKMYNIKDMDRLPCSDSGDPGGWNGSDSLMAPERCRSCYGLRLEKTAEQARALGFDAFTTTLLISPYQDIEGIAAIGKALAGKYNVEFYYRDFRPYFREAMVLSRELGLYRQKYCGCVFSREESEKARKARRAGKAEM